MAPSVELDVRNDGANGIAEIGVRGGTNGAGVVQISGHGTTYGSTSFDLIQNSSGAYVYNRSNTLMIFGTNNTERMRIDASGNVSLASATSLDFNVADFAQIKFKESGAITIDSDNNQSSRNFQFKDGDGSSLMFIGDDGNVGIGTTSPESGAKLDVRAGSGGKIVLGSYDANYKVVVEGGDQLNFFNGASGTTAYINYGGPADVLLSRNFYVEANSSGGTSGTVRIKSDGKVGIGTTSPSTKLHISGGDSAIRITPTGGNDPRIDFTDSGGTVRFYSGYDVSSGNFVVTSDEGGFGSSNIMVMSDAGNVIIGNTSVDNPNSLSKVLEIEHGGSVGLILNDSRDNPIGLENRGAVFHLTHNTNSRLVVDGASGSVGIGTTTPQFTLEVDGAASAMNAHFGQGQNNSSGVFGGISLGYAEANTSYRKVGIVAQAKGDGAARQDLHFLVDTVGDSGSAGIADSKMHIQYNTGDVIIDNKLGIGTTSPGAKLDIVGSSSGSITNLLRIQNPVNSAGTGHGASLILHSTSDSNRGVAIASSSATNYATNNNMLFYTSSSSTLYERMRIDSNGQVGIGTSSPGYKLDVDSTAAGDWITRIKNQSSTGYGLYVQSSNNAAQYLLGLHNGDAYQFIVNGAGSVGIGTTSPNQEGFGSGNRALSVKAPSSGGVANLELIGLGNADNDELGYVNFMSQSATNSAASIVGLRHTSDTSGKLVFRTANVERMRITENGDVGIGDLTPSSSLQAFGSASKGLSIANQQPTIALTDTDTGSRRAYLAYEGGSYQFYLSSPESNGIMTFQTGGFNERMRITSGGNVGIGTTSPNQQLDVSGNIAVRGGYKIYFNSEVNLNRYIGASSSNDLDIAADDDINYRSNFNRFFNGSTEFARLSGSGVSWLGGGSNGYVGIGTTSPTVPLAVHGQQKWYTTSADGNELRGFFNPGGASDGAELYLYRDDGATQGVALRGQGNSYFRVDSTSDKLINFYYGTSNVGQIVTGGTNVLYQSNSDYRLKENVVEMTGALDRVSQLKPSRYNFISHPGEQVDGFMAHELQEVVPQAVSGEKDEMNEDGTPKYQGVDHSQIVPLLVGAIKELKAEIETLKTQINK